MSPEVVQEVSKQVPGLVVLAAVVLVVTAEMWTLHMELMALQ